MKISYLDAYLLNSIDVSCKLHIANILHRANNRSALSTAVSAAAASGPLAAKPVPMQQSKTAKTMDIPQTKLHRQQKPLMHSWPSEVM